MPARPAIRRVAASSSDIMSGARTALSFQMIMYPARPPGNDEPKQLDSFWSRYPPLASIVTFARCSEASDTLEWSEQAKSNLAERPIPEVC